LAMYRRAVEDVQAFSAALSAPRVVH
jgi:hypothetical protein